MDYGGTRIVVYRAAGHIRYGIRGRRKFDLNNCLARVGDNAGDHGGRVILHRCTNQDNTDETMSANIHYGRDNILVREYLDFSKLRITNACGRTR